jgi:signal transduction histidine kinase
LTIALFVLIVLEVPLGVFVADRQRRELVTSLERDALVIATVYEDALDRNAPYSPGPAADYASSSGTRVVVVDLDGRSIVDTERPVNQDFTNRDEVVRALSGEIVSGRRASETLGRDLLYVAVPVASGGVVYGAVRITADPADVEERINRFWWTLAGVAVVVLAAMAFVGWVIARSIARPIEAVRDAAVRAGEGDLDVRIDPGDAPPELRDLVSQFNQMAAQIRDLVDRQRSFVGDASHQLRTPLTALRLRLENLEVEIEGRYRGDVGAALDEVDRLGRLVEQLLVLARTEDGPLPAEETDLSRQVSERVDLWAAVAEERKVRVEAAGVDQPSPVLALPGAVEQVLDNLIDNALLASPEGSVVTVRIESGTDSHRIHVVDCGSGMSKEQQRRAFDRFWRNDPSREGTGLGLAIVRQLAVASGGDVQLRDAPAGGLEVVVTFPAVSVLSPTSGG